MSRELGFVHYLVGGLGGFVMILTADTPYFFVPVIAIAVYVGFVLYQAKRREEG